MEAASEVVEVEAVEVVELVERWGWDRVHCCCYRSRRYVVLERVVELHPQVESY